MDYTNFAVDDFVTDDYFLQWVCQNDAEAEKFWNLFVSLHPEVKPKIDLARAIVLNLKSTGYTDITDNQIDGIWKDITKAIDDSESLPGGKVRRFQIKYGIAASLIAAAIFTGVFYLVKKNAETAERNFSSYAQTDAEGFVEEVNTSSNTARIHLSDGSVVSLEKNSRLIYKRDYKDSDSRHVYLTGGAFFEVAPNPGQPFFVHANEVITKVLGTCFTVKAYENEKDITVAVKSGKVSVFSPRKVSATPDKVHSEVDGVILLPNQQVVYQRAEESFDKTLVQSPVILTKPEETASFIFENTPIKDVFLALERAYGIEILFNEEAMKDCFITAPLGSEPVFEKLRIICRTIGASYEVIDTKIVINSTGCQ